MLYHIPHNFKEPEFVIFIREDSRNIWEHVSQFNAQLGIHGSLDHLKIRMFPLSLSGTVFSWFSALSPNSIHTWSQLEHKFHEHFYNGDNELRLSHSTLVRQKVDEPIAEYIRRFRDTKNRCYSLIISEKDLAELALNGLRSHIKEKLEGYEFLTINQVLQRALAQESRSKEYKTKSDHLGIHVLDCDSSDDESKEVYAAEFVWSSKDKPSTCAYLKPIDKNRHDEVKFTFDVSKCGRIFDELAKIGKIKFSHTIPPMDELKRRAYCKFHNTCSHATNDCNVFHRQIQSATNEGRWL
jgi:hypothetical protein